MKDTSRFPTESKAIVKLAMLLAFLLALTSLAFAADAPCVAIIAEPSATAAADLLTAEFSKQPVKLLERTEIDHILGEQRLSVVGFTAGRSAQIGALLGADGLIFLGVEKVGGKEVLAARLVAVHPGVIVGAWQEPAPAADLVAWGHEKAVAIATLLPKLTVTREAAIPISVVNLRATRARPEAAEIESEIALLLVHHLAHEPAFFVLERQQMDALLGEEHDATAAFWTGRYLVEGAIEQDLIEPERLTIRLRLQAPGRGEAVEIVHRCRRAELVEAAEALTREIAKKLQRGLTVAKWNAAQEAEQFWQDAQWAFRNEIFARAATASESSRALGNKNAETLALRVRAELLAARPELVVPFNDPKNNQYLRDYMTERNWLWRAERSFTRGYRTPDVLARIFEEMPDAERQSRLARTQRAVELFRDHCEELLTEPGQIPLATHVLTIGGAMLEWFHDNRAPWDDGMRRLAAALREADEVATRRVRELATRADYKPPPLFWQSKVALTPLWAADASQTLATFRAALHEPFDAETGATLRATMIHSRDLFPNLAAGTEPALDAEAWAKFTAELPASDLPPDIRERSQEALLRFPKLRSGATQGGVMKITRYWHPYRLTQFRDGSLKAADLDLHDAIFRHGRLWIFATFERSEEGHDRKQSQFIFGINLKTFDAEVIAFEPPPPLAVLRKHNWGGTNLEISPDAIFVSNDWQLSRYDRGAKTWRHFSELPGVWEQPWLIGGRLYVRINNFPGPNLFQHFGEMVELDPKTGAPTLLVSDRRNPAESPLDTWPTSWLTARPGKDGLVLFRGLDSSEKKRFAAYDPVARRWQPLDEATWNKHAGGGAAANMAVANGDGAWEVEDRSDSRKTFSLVSGKRRIPFRCELTAKDRTLLSGNGANPPFDVIEQNLMPGLGAAPLGYETPDGIAISPVFPTPGFWFVPNSDIERETERRSPVAR